MHPGTLAIVIFVGVAIAAGVISVAVRWLNAQPKWRTLTLPGFSVEVAGSVNDAQLSNALLLALEVLQPVWPGASLKGADLHIIVMDVESWLNIAGIRVGGEQGGNRVRVGKNLSALAHELAHFFQQTRDDEIDAAHESWMSRGIWRADDVYRAALRSSP